MAWKRDNRGYFNPSQRNIMITMYADQHKSIQQIAKAAGCAPGSVRNILINAGVYPEVKKRGKRKAPAVTDSTARAESLTGTMTEHTKQENSYLRWVVSGIINHVKDQNFVERLVDDLGKGTFDP